MSDPVIKDKIYNSDDYKTMDNYQNVLRLVCQATNLDEWISFLKSANGWEKLLY